MLRDDTIIIDARDYEAENLCFSTHFSNCTLDIKPASGSSVVKAGEKCVVTATWDADECPTLVLNGEDVDEDEISFTGDIAPYLAMQITAIGEAPEVIVEPRATLRKIQLVRDENGCRLVLTFEFVASDWYSGLSAIGAISTQGFDFGFKFGSGTETAVVPFPDGAVLQSAASGGGVAGDPSIAPQDVGPIHFHFSNDGRATIVVKGLNKGDNSRLLYSTDGMTWSKFDKSTVTVDSSHPDYYFKMPRGYAFDTNFVLSKFNRGDMTLAAYFEVKVSGSSGSPHVSVSGDLLSLYRREDKLLSNDLACLFCYSDALYDASGLILPEMGGRVGTYASFQGMFAGCTSLVAPPSVIPYYQNSDEVCYCMFKGCSNLAHVPRIEALPLEKAFTSMFEGCTSLVDASDVFPDTITKHQARYQCCKAMFKGCTNLTTPPKYLPVSFSPPKGSLWIHSKSSWSSFEEMFMGCSKLTSAPDLKCDPNAGSPEYRGVPVYCYSHMFDGCTALTALPMIEYLEHAVGDTLDTTSEDSAERDIRADASVPKFNVLPHGCEYMFANTGINEVRGLYANDVYYAGCAGMFSGCKNMESVSNIRFVRSVLESDLNPNAYNINETPVYNMFSGAGYSSSPLSYTCIDLFGIELGGGDNNFHANRMFANSAIASVRSVRLHANVLCNQMFADVRFIHHSGNTTSHSLDAITDESFIFDAPYVYQGDNAVDFPIMTEMFAGSWLDSSGTSHWLRILYTTKLKEGQYKGMFKNCPYFNTIVRLPATTLAKDCYLSMFEGCTALTSIYLPYYEIHATSMKPKLVNNAPEVSNGSLVYENTTTSCLIVPSTACANSCFYRMFAGCSSLKWLPRDYINTGKFADTCYYEMFRDCTGLIVPCGLPDPVQGYQDADLSHGHIFQGCTNLIVYPDISTQYSNLHIDPYEIQYSFVDTGIKLYGSHESPSPSQDYTYLIASPAHRGDRLQFNRFRWDAIVEGEDCFEPHDISSERYVYYVKNNDVAHVYLKYPTVPQP